MTEVAILNTLLSLGRYADIMGLPGPHFWGGTLGNAFPPGSCSAIWRKYPWQANDMTSRLELAQAIYTAEEEIARLIGYYPAPVWIEHEPHPYPRHHRPDAYGAAVDNRLRHKSLSLKWGRFIQAGVRAVTLVATATTATGALAYADPDGDGYNEIASVVVPTTLTDVSELKLYHPGHSGEQEWEIRPLLAKTANGVTATFTLWSWLLVKPSLYETFPTTSVNPTDPIDLTAAASLETSVDVYREYTDSSEPSAVFYWEPDPHQALPLAGSCSVCGGTGCVACAHTTQDGCLFVRDILQGLVGVQPAAYSDTDAAWTASAWSVCREPDIVKVFYHAGDQDDKYLAGRTYDPLSDFWAETIAWLATTRLERGVCACANATALFNWLREDITERTRDLSHYVTYDALRSPFGTRRGEVIAYRRVAKFVERRTVPALI